MSFPDQIQHELTGRPRLLAGSTGTLLNGRPISQVLAGTMAARALSSEIDPAAKLWIGLNCELSMSPGNASLGHACVSPAAQSPDLATGEFHADGQSFSVLGKGSADGRFR